LTSIIEKRISLHKKLKDLQQENEHLKSEAEQLERLAILGTNTAMIAHEINNLLTPLSNYAQLALQNSEDRRLAQKALTKTARNCEKASDFMQSILNLSSQSKNEKELVKISDLVSDAFKCIGRDFKRDCIKVKTDIPDDLEIEAVRVQMQQIIINLVLNARDSMLSGGGTLHISAEKAGDNTVHIQIKDSGKGIKNEDIKQVFKPFFTTKNTPGGEKSGSGLGLAYCKRIIDKHNGSISVSSTFGEGTAFYISLPITAN
jgi:signal transduction histidine kinase